MNFLLDTHTFLWFLNDDSALSPPARALIESADHAIFLSVASVWEVAIKVSLGKLTLPSPFADFVTRQLEENDITLYPIQIAHTALVVTMPFHHRDPFDRLIIAQSLADNLAVIGQDTVFDLYGVQRHW